MSLFGGLGRGIGNLWQGYGKGLVTGVVSQYLGQGAGRIVGGVLQNKRDRREMRGPEQSFDVSTLWNPTSTNFGQMFAGGLAGYMDDPGLQVASRYQNPIRTQDQVGLTSSGREPQYYDEETDTEEDYYED